MEDDNKIQEEPLEGKREATPSVLVGVPSVTGQKAQRKLRAKNKKGRKGGRRQETCQLLYIEVHGEVRASGRFGRGAPPMALSFQYFLAALCVPAILMPI